MKLQLCTFEQAKALKELGFPQGKTDEVYSLENYSCYTVGGLYSDYAIDFVKTCDAPFAMEVWLWLWREKNIQIDIDYARYNTAAIASMLVKGEEFPDVFEKKDPEEAIEKAIEYLVENDLIK